MTTHATLPDTATISARIAQLSLLPMDSLWALWDEHFDQRPNHHHRTWLESRLAYKFQERAYGGLKVSVRRKLESKGWTSFGAQTAGSAWGRTLHSILWSRR